MWLTGLPAAGKTSLALALDEHLQRRGVPACVLDGDELRDGLSSDLGLSADDRTEQARRAGHVAALVARSGVIAIVALVSPFTDDRRRARKLHVRQDLRFVEVWVDTPLAICQARDPKGLYARARAGALTGLRGLDAPYEPPQRPELRVNGSGETGRRGRPHRAATRAGNDVVTLSPRGWRGRLADKARDRAVLFRIWRGPSPTARDGIA